MMVNVRVKWALGLLCLAAPSLFADTIALTASADNVITNSGTYTLGWSFSANSPITITSLGVYDARANGLNVAHDVGIWDTQGNLLASATVPPGIGPVFDSGYVFVSISPLALNPGSKYYVGAVYFVNDNDGWLYDPLTLATAPQITYLSRQYANSSGSLVFPNLVGAGTAGYFGGNFAFRDSSPVPEPSPMIFMSTMLIGIFVAQKRIAWDRAKSFTEINVDIRATSCGARQPFPVASAASPTPRNSS